MSCWIMIDSGAPQCFIGDEYLNDYLADLADPTQEAKTGDQQQNYPSIDEEGLRIPLERNETSLPRYLVELKNWAHHESQDGTLWVAVSHSEMYVLAVDVSARGVIEKLERSPLGHHWIEYVKMIAKVPFLENT